MWFGFPFRNQVWILATEKIKLPDRQDSELFGETREAMIAKYSCPKRHGVGELAPEARRSLRLRGLRGGGEAVRRPLPLAGHTHTGATSDGKGSEDEKNSTDRKHCEF